MCVFIIYTEHIIDILYHEDLFNELYTCVYAHIHTQEIGYALQYKNPWWTIEMDELSP